MTNVVINSILWYINQRMKQQPNDVLAKLVVDYYSSDDIDSARDKLCKNFPDEFCPSNSRKKSFKGAENVLAQKNCKDIISVLHEMAVSEKFVPPIFATADMNFPSVDVANLDATTIYNDLLALKKEVKQLHDEKDLEKVVLQDIQSALQEVKEERSIKKDVLDSIFDSIMVNKSQLPNCNNLLLKASDSNADKVSAADIGLLEITSSAMNVASNSQSSAKSYAAATAGTLSSKLSKVGNAKNCDTVLEKNIKNQYLTLV